MQCKFRRGERVAIDERTAVTFVVDLGDGDAKVTLATGKPAVVHMKRLTTLEPQAVPPVDSDGDEATTPETESPGSDDPVKGQESAPVATGDEDDSSAGPEKKPSDSEGGGEDGAEDRGAPPAAGAGPSLNSGEAPLASPLAADPGTIEA